MNLLLDTRVALWALARPFELSSEVRARIVESPRVCVSAVSAWELVHKAALGHLQPVEGFAGAARAAGFEELALSFAHAEAARALPVQDADPFDRLLAAQALVEGLTLVTADPRMRAYKVPVLLV